MSRYPGPARIRRSSPAASRYDNEARKLLGELEVRAGGGVAVLAAQRPLPGGGMVRAIKAGNQRISSTIVPTSGGGGKVEMVEMIHLYVSSPTGLYIFDLESKAMVNQFSGLFDYDVDSVSKNGKVVMMSGEGIAVRLDIADGSAFGYGYEVDAANTTGNPANDTGIAQVLTGMLSPKGDRHLLIFTSTVSEVGGTIDGLGGAFLVDAETLEPVRDAIRMSYRRHRAAWRRDGERFYIATSLTSDVPDTANVAVTTSQFDYIATFDSDGQLLATTQILDWGAPRDSGLGSGVLAMVASPSNDRLYTMENVVGDPFYLRIYDCSNDAVSLLASVEVDDWSYYMQCSRVGNKLMVLMLDHTWREYDVSNDTFELVDIHSIPDTDATFGAFSTLWPAGLIQNSVESRVGRQPDPRRFHFDGDTKMVNGYRSFSNQPVYTLDLSEYDPRSRYRLANVGSKQRPTP